jgi:hypothetical protein
MTALRQAPLAIGLLALVFAAPAAAQPSDPAPKDSGARHLKPKGCLASIQYIVRDGVRHQCGYSYNHKLETCVLTCNPPLRPKR